MVVDELAIETQHVLVGDIMAFKTASYFRPPSVLMTTIHPTKQYHNTFYLLFPLPSTTGIQQELAHQEKPMLLYRMRS